MTQDADNTRDDAPLDFTPSGDRVQDAVRLASLVRSTFTPEDHEVLASVRMRDLYEPRKPIVYVSGPSRELDRCVRAMARIQELGAENALDWTAEIIRQGAGTPESPQAQLEAAMADLNAVASCDAMLFLDGENPSPGRWVELGAAWASGKPIVGARARGLRGYLWHRLLSLEFSSDEDACLAAVEMARRMIGS